MSVRSFVLGSAALALVGCYLPDPDRQEERDEFSLAESDFTGFDDDTAGGGDTSGGDDDTSGGGGDDWEGTPTEMAIHRLINEWRADNELPPIPYSPALSRVARVHAEDLTDHAPHQQGGGCNLHSWSDQGEWTACCYTSDHAAAQCMWDKPREITEGYTGNGYENSYWAGGGVRAEQAVEGWKNSPGHNAVMINLGSWSTTTWQAMGVGVDGQYANVWFGRDVDPLSPE